MKTVKMSHVCTLSPEPIGGLWGGGGGRGIVFLRKQFSFYCYQLHLKTLVVSEQRYILTREYERNL